MAGLQALRRRRQWPDLAAEPPPGCKVPPLPPSPVNTRIRLARIRLCHRAPRPWWEGYMGKGRKTPSSFPNATVPPMRLSPSMHDASTAAAETAAFWRPRCGDVLQRARGGDDGRRAAGHDHRVLVRGWLKYPTPTPPHPHPHPYPHTHTHTTPNAI